MEDGPAPWQKLLGDPLKEVTRKERRALLAVSVAALAIAKAGLTPIKIESIGIEFSAANKPVLLYIILGVVVYFLIAFAVYAASDFIAWQRSYYELIDRIEDEEAQRQYRAEEEESGMTNVVVDIQPVDRRKLAWRSILRRAIAPTSVIRAAVEFVVPVALGIFAAASLLSAAR